MLPAARQARGYSAPSLHQERCERDSRAPHRVRRGYAGMGAARGGDDEEAGALADEALRLGTESSLVLYHAGAPWRSIDRKNRTRRDHQVTYARFIEHQGAEWCGRAVRAARPAPAG